MDKILKKWVYVICSSVILSLLLNNSFQSSTVEAAQELTISNPLPLPVACTFDDGDDPLDPDQCLVMVNNGFTGDFDNIFFTLNALENFDKFTCTLLNSLNQPVEDPTAGDCTTGPNTAQVKYTDLATGEYSFYVVGTKKGVVTTNTNGLVKDVVMQSPKFNFLVGDAEGGEVPGSPGGVEEFPSETAQQGADAQSDNLKRLNPIWRTCDADTGTSGGAGGSTQPPPGTDKNGDKRLSAMKYLLFGKFSFDDLVEELKKFDRNEFVLEIRTNFQSGYMVAEVYPNVKSVPKIQTTEDLYKLDPFFMTADQVPRDRKDVPDRTPVDVQSIDTQCLYQAPVIATSANRGGVGTAIDTEVFASSNPPFETCEGESIGAVYSITFWIDRDDIKKFARGLSDVRFTIEQQLTEEKPAYTGSLSFDPFEDDEKRIALSLDGNNIVTACTNTLKY